jgi:hypothetical protein
MRSEYMRPRYGRNSNVFAEAGKAKIRKTTSRGVQVQQKSIGQSFVVVMGDHLTIRVLWCVRDASVVNATLLMALCRKDDVG